MKAKSSLAIIGMAGVGKSHTAKLLAVRLGLTHAEVDHMITDLAHERRVDKDTLSDAEFIELEERAILSLKDKTGLVIDTGGSVVYSEAAMSDLKEMAFIVYLYDDPVHIKERFDQRGEPHLIGMTEGKTFERLLEERDTGYRKYCDMVVDVSVDHFVGDIIEAFQSSS